MDPYVDDGYWDADYTVLEAVVGAIKDFLIRARRRGVR